MKVKVIKEFVDKHTNRLHKMGSTFECDKTRFKEIKEAGSFIEPVSEPKKEKVNKTKKVERVK